jgi:hypothetical protein
MNNLKTTLSLMFACITSVLCAQQPAPATIVTDTLAAKQKIRVQEYGIGFYNLNNYSLQYRWGTPKVLYRINANVGYTGFSNSSSATTNYANMGFGYSSNDIQIKTPVTLNTSLGFSVLTIKQINPKFGLMLGGTAGLTYSYTTGQNTQTNTYQDSSGNPISRSVTTKTRATTLQPYMGFVLGVFYKITPSFIIYAEIAPNIYYAASQTSSSATITNQPSGTSYRSGDRLTNSSNIGLSGFSNSGAMLTLVYRITK